MFVLVTLATLGRVEAHLTRRPRFRSVTAETDDAAERLRNVITTLESLVPAAELHRTDRNRRQEAVTLVFRVRANDRGVRDVIRTLALAPNVRSVYES